ncbi:MAG: cobalt-precorrin-5B (C(1))-methyltransferase CbiD [Lachnospiraceae bacterium]|nr:cobalt-precorrin-5B (C(1))-methyltransferase CbiD [Lachnospiraceae bacterium]
MRYGFTTGSCAAAAAKAAAYMLLTGRAKTTITIETPKGIPYTAQILDIRRSERAVSCAVEKDGGDDPDITTGAWIYAEVSYEGDTGDRGINEKALLETEQEKPEKKQRIRIKGGTGVGRVTRVGLDQPVGNAAINHVPREMIRKEVMEVCRITDYTGGLEIEISVPEGERLSEHTFNPKLGVVGGISILGTSGVVEPMSSQAILDTIRIELRQRREEGFDYVAVSLGNYGLDFMQRTYGYDLDRSVKCSNFIGETIDMAVEMGFCKMLMTGHIGKLIKVAGGIMNTHSREADCRMELLAAFCVRQQINQNQICRVLECVSTEEALPILQESGKMQTVMDYIVERICYYMENRSGGRLKIDCILYANGYGELARSKEAEGWFTLLGQEQVQ